MRRFKPQRYWQDRILELREQIALMDEPPLWVASGKIYGPLLPLT